VAFRGAITILSDAVEDRLRASDMKEAAEPPPGTSLESEVMRVLKVSLVVLLLMKALPACAQDQPAGNGDPWADNYHLTVPKMITVVVGALAGGALLYVIGEQLFVDTVVDTSVGVAQTVVASDIAEHSGIVTAMTIFGGTIGGVLSGIGYDRYSGDIKEFFNSVKGVAQQVVVAAAGLVYDAP
jgi:hypothetical protein